MKDFKDLKVWERGHKLTLEIYKITSGFPREEMYGLTSTNYGFYKENCEITGFRIRSGMTRKHQIA
jgi:hypothetical protein